MERWGDHQPVPCRILSGIDNVGGDAALTEACFLIMRRGGNPEDLLELVERGLLQVRFELHEEASRVRALMKRYRKFPMSLADACLVRMSERITDCRVVTFDKNFRVYRRHDRRPIPVLMPDKIR